MDGHSKRVRNIWYEVEERYCSISFLKPAANWSVIYDFFATWSRDISRDLLTQYFDSAP